MEFGPMCKRFGPAKDVCDKMVKEDGDELIDMIINHTFTDDICYKRKWCK